MTVYCSNNLVLSPREIMFDLQEKNKKEPEEVYESTLEKKIQDLPCELQRQMYEYLKYDLWFEEFKKALTSVHSFRLDIQKIRPWVPRIIAIKPFNLYCRKKIASIDTVFRIEKLQNKKMFTLMKRGNSFAQSILMFMYH